MESEDELRARFTPLDIEGDEEAFVTAQRQALQAVLENEEITAELRRQAARLGMSLEAFDRIIERDQKLAAEVLEVQERSERARARVGAIPDGSFAADAATAGLDAKHVEASAAEGGTPPPVGVDMEQLSQFLARAGLSAGDGDSDSDGDGAGARAGAGTGDGAGGDAQRRKPFNPAEVAAKARAMIPVYSRQVWTMMFPPPGYGGRDPRWVHEAKQVPVDRRGEYAQLGFTFKPLAPILSDEHRPVECGIHTTLGYICRKRFDNVQDRLLHWRAKHPAEYEALLFAAREAEQRRQQERWELERKQRELALEIQRKQLALLEQQAQAMATRPAVPATETEMKTELGPTFSPTSEPELEAELGLGLEAKPEAQAQAETRLEPETGIAAATATTTVTNTSTGTGTGTGTGATAGSGAGSGASAEAALGRGRVYRPPWRLSSSSSAAMER